MSTPPQQPGDDASKPIESQIDALLSQSEAVQAKPAEPNESPAPISSAEIESLLDGPPSASPPTQSASASQADPEQAEMLAALSSALLDLPEDPPAAAPADELSTEEQLQQEISALMNAEPEAAAVAPADDAGEMDDFDALGGSFESPESLGATTQAIPQAEQAAALTTEDQIAMEIEGLLGVDEAPAEPAAADSPAQESIDALDQMLAEEIDADDELAGDFHSVEDITAGIEVPDELQAEDHAATARDVAAELDSQPEDLLTATPPEATAAQAEPTADPIAAMDDNAPPAEPSASDDQRRAALEVADKPHWLQTARQRLLNACFLINWPARRFLTAEWRANLGYIALLNLFFGLGLWIVLIVF